jgi:hypothetical protein
MELYNNLIISSLRSKFNEFMIKNYKYDNLVKMITELESNSNEKNIFIKALLGTDSSNSYSAFYLLPTYELIDIMINIIKFFKVANFEELCAGMGLTSVLLKSECEKNNINVNVVASDNYSNKTTNVTYDFMKIKKKAIKHLHIQIDQNIKVPEFIYLAYPDSNCDIELLSIIETMRLPLIMMSLTNVQGNYVLSNNVVDKLVPKNYYIETEYLKKLGYKSLVLWPKQLSLYDYFYHNCFLKYMPIRTFSILIIRDDYFNKALNFTNKYEILDSDYTLQLKFMKLFGMNNFIQHKTLTPKYHNLSRYQRSLDMAIDGKLPLWIAKLGNHDYPDNHPMNSMYNVAIEIAISCFQNNKIPDYIQNLDELKFWYNEIKNKVYPLLINNREEFINYYTSIIKVKNNNIVSLHNENIIPHWIRDNSLALAYIRLDFSTDINDKQWKTNVHLFTQRYINLFNE